MLRRHVALSQLLRAWVYSTYICVGHGEKKKMEEYIIVIIHKNMMEFSDEWK